MQGFPSEAKRLLDNEKLTGRPEAKVLSRRVALVEACQKLAQASDLHAMDAEDRTRMYQLVAGNDVSPNDNVKLKVWLAHIMQIDIAKTADGRKEFIDILVPFPPGAKAAFDWFAPSFAGVLALCMARDEPSDFGLGSSWALDVETIPEEKPEGPKEEKPDWEAFASSS